MRREDLTAKGLTAEQVDFVMAEYGKELNPMESGERFLQGTAWHCSGILKGKEGIDAAGLQTKVTELTNQLKGKDTEIEKIRSDYTFDSAVREAIRKASGRNEKAIMALLDIDTLKASKNQAQDITAALDTLKKDNDYLFQAEKKTPHVVSVTSGINPEAQTKREQANEALRSLLGRGE